MNNHIKLLLSALFFLLLYIIIYTYFVSGNPQYLSPAITLLGGILVWDIFKGKIALINVFRTRTSMCEYCNFISIKYHIKNINDVQRINIVGNRKVYLSLNTFKITTERAKLKIDLDTDIKRDEYNNITIILNWEKIVHNRDIIKNLFLESPYIVIEMFDSANNRMRSNKWFRRKYYNDNEIKNLVEGTSGICNREECTRKWAYEFWKNDKNNKIQKSEKYWYEAEKCIDRDCTSKDGNAILEKRRIFLKSP